MKLRIFMISVVVLCSVATAFAFTDGSDLMLLSGSASMLGRADTGVASFGSDTFITNPAALAREERFTGSVNYGSMLFDY
ncbi:MAG TPA: hypothetical protein PLZ29_07260, partial [Spirochaetota bacterium]|nr:hypothetical protein [Spirochaetota bacterium]